MDKLTVQEIRRTEDLVNVRPEWDSLVAEDPDHTVFQTFDYVSSWLEVFGKDSPLRVLLVRDRTSHKLAAIVPFYVKRQKGIRRLHMLCDTHSDYTQIVSSIDPVLLGKVVVDHLKEASGWDCLYFNSFRAGTATDGLVQALETNQLIVQKSAVSTAPYLALSGNYEGFFDRLPKNVRQDTRRQRKRLAEMGALAFVPVARESLKEDLDIFFRMHSERWRGIDSVTTFEIDGNRAFYLKIAERLLRNGTLAFHKLMVGDQVAAMHFGYRNRDRFYYFKPTFSMAFKRFSVGRILMLELIKLSYEEGFDIFDFMAGDEKYKYAFTVMETPLNRAFVFRNGIKGKALSRLRTMLAGQG